ncbi:hypothetical protein ACFQXA_29655 [Nocardiopsis composta]
MRAVSDGLEYLVLADCAVLLPAPGAPPRVVTDDRLDRLPGGRPYTRELVRSMRNRPGGFWVAGADPGRAHQAVTGVHSGPGGRFGLLTDGCTRLAERFGHGWGRVWDRLEGPGPGRSSTGSARRSGTGPGPSGASRTTTPPRWSARSPRPPAAGASPGVIRAAAAA